MTQLRDQDAISLEQSFMAIKNGNLQLLQAVTRISDQKKIDADGQTLIKFAAHLNQWEIVDYLLDKVIYVAVCKNKEVNKDDQFQLNSVLLYAVDKIADVKKLEKIIARLFECGAQGCRFEFTGTKQNALHLVARKEVTFKNVLDLLLEHATEQQRSYRDKSNKTPVDYLIENNNIEFINIWSKKNKIDIRHSFESIKNNKLNILRALTTITDQNQLGADGQTLIRLAAHLNQWHIVDYLLSDVIYKAVSENKEVNKDDQFQLGRVLLYAVDKIADAKKLEEFVVKLFECGALGCQIQFCDTKKNALHVVASRGIPFKNLLELLLKHATLDQINTLDSSHQLPVDYSVKDSNHELTAMFFEWEKYKIQEYFIILYILFNAKSLPLEVLKIISCYLYPRSSELIDKFPDYQFLLRAKCVLEEYKKRNSLSLKLSLLSIPSDNLIKNFEKGIKEKSVDFIRKSVKEFFDKTVGNDKQDNSAIELLKKYCFVDKNSRTSNAASRSVNTPRLLSFLSFNFNIQPTVQKYRQLIDVGQDKNDAKVQTAQKELSLKYILSPEEGGFTFRINDLKDYLDDWVFRDIYTAEEFIKLAIDQSYELFDKIFRTHDAVFSDNEKTKEKVASLQGIITGYFEKKGQAKSEEIAQRAYHYAGLDEDLDKVVYDIKDISIYLEDWLRGIDLAEAFLIKAMEQDISKLLSLVKDPAIRPEKRKRVLKFLFDHREIHSNFIDIIASHLIEAFNTTADSKKLASILEDFHKMGVMKALTGQERYKKKGFLVLDLVDLETLLDFCQFLNPKDEEIASRLFCWALGCPDSYLSSNMQEALQQLKANLNSFDSDSLSGANEKKTQENSSLSLSVTTCLDDEITLDYYIVSIGHNAKAMLEIADKNPEKFTALFCRELDSLMVSFQEMHKEKTPKSKHPINPLNHRKAFYQELMVELKAKSSLCYNDCLSKVNATLKANSIEPLNMAPIVTTTLTETKTAYALNISHSSETARNETTNIVNPLLKFSPVFGVVVKGSENTNEPTKRKNEKDEEAITKQEVRQ